MSNEDRIRDFLDDTEPLLLPPPEFLPSLEIDGLSGVVRLRNADGSVITYGFTGQWWRRMVED